MAYVEVMKKLNDIGNYKAKDAQLIAKEYINKSDINSKDKKAISDFIGKIAKLSDEVFDDF